MTDKRTFTAWVICGQFLKLHGSPAMPFYKQLPDGRDFPWFKTKREATEFMREHFRRDNTEIRGSVRKVTLTMEACDE